jgi:hypothetical protein
MMPGPATLGRVSTHPRPIRSTPVAGTGAATGSERAASAELPLAGHVNRAMRAHVRAAGTRRALPTVLHLGHPGAAEVQVPEQEWYDAGVRADLVARALEGLDDPAPLAWLTRSGELEAGDVDLAWCAAVRSGYARHGIALAGFFLVTRRGWADLITGERHEWRRVRLDPRSATD